MPPPMLPIVAGASAASAAPAVTTDTATAIATSRIAPNVPHLFDFLFGLGLVGAGFADRLGRVVGPEGRGAEPVVGHSGRERSGSGPRPAPTRR